MGSTAEDYGRVLWKLRPPGRGLVPKPGGLLEELLAGLGAEYAELEKRVADLVRESDPRETVELLEEWKREVGLPSACLQDLEVAQAWRAAVVAILRAQGGASLQLYQDLAATLGYTIEITEYHPFAAGVSSAGEALTNGPWLFTWDVHATEISPVFFTAGSGQAGEPLQVNHNELLSCLIAAAAPAHTLPRFFFDLPYTGYQPWYPVEFYPGPMPLTLEPQAPTIDD